MNEEEAIVACALDYYEGWFDGDAGRMERALHADLVKRSLGEDGETLDTIGARDMIDWTVEGAGKRLDPGDRKIEVTVDDIFEDIATVTVHSTVYVDYLQLVRTRAGWKIANVVFQWTREGLAIRESVRGRASSAPRAGS